MLAERVQPPHHHHGTRDRPGIPGLTPNSSWPSGTPCPAAPLLSCGLTGLATTTSHLIFCGPRRWRGDITSDALALSDPAARPCAPHHPSTAASAAHLTLTGCSHHQYASVTISRKMDTHKKKIHSPNYRKRSAVFCVAPTDSWERLVVNNEMGIQRRQRGGLRYEDEPETHQHEHR